MKTIELKAARENVFLPGVGQRDIIITTYQILKEVLNNKPTPEHQFTISEMRQRLVILDRLEAYRIYFTIEESVPISEVSEEFLKQSFNLLLEDYDYRSLQTLVLNMKWGVVSFFISDFVAQFEDIPVNQNGLKTVEQY